MCIDLFGGFGFEDRWDKNLPAFMWSRLGVDVNAGIRLKNSIFIMMNKFAQHIHPAIFVLIATVCEVAGDALIRKCLYEYSGAARVLLFIAGAVLLCLYGSALNLAPVPFQQVVGLYIATLFIVWQIGNYIAFRSFPSLPILIGGVLIVAGGLIVTFWTPGK